MEHTLNAQQRILIKKSLAMLGSYHSYRYREDMQVAIADLYAMFSDASGVTVTMPPLPCNNVKG